MIAVYMRPDYTQIVVAKQKKQKLKIQSCTTIKQNYLSCLESINPNTVTDLEFFFKDVKSISQKSGDEIYLVLPDYIFSMVNCFPSIGPEQTRDEIFSRLAVSGEQVEYSLPIVTSPEPQKPLVTACVLSTEIVDVLVEAANHTESHLVSIEAASVAFLRAKSTYNQEELALFIFKDNATFIAYSQLGGLFKVDNNDLSLESLGNTSKDEAEQTILAACYEFEMTAKATFEYLNHDLKYTIFAEPNAINSFDTLAERNAPLKYLPENLVDASAISPDEQQDWLCAVGTLLQDIDFSSEHEQFEELIDSYEQVSSGNVLPDEIQNRSKKYHRIQQMYRAGKATIVAMCFISLAELVAIWLFSATQIPPGLEDDYESAKDSISKIEAELNIINLERQEDQQPLSVYNAVMATRPQEVGFVSFEVGNDSKTNSNDWVKIKMLAADPLKFQNYVNSLSNDSMFSSVAIPQITTDNSSSAKVANMVLGKKEGTK